MVNVYFYSGHGEEYCEDGKVVSSIVPAHTTYVTGAVSGCVIVGDPERAVSFVGKFHDMHANLDVSALSKLYYGTKSVMLSSGSQIYQSIHVHPESTKYHVSRFLPHLIYEKGKNTILVTAGVVKQPDTPDAPYNYRYEVEGPITSFKISKKDYMLLHRRVVWPAPDALKKELEKYSDPLNAADIDAIGRTFLTTTDKLMSSIGPGIHYFMACRSAPKGCEEDSYRARSESAYEHDTWYNTIEATIQEDKNAAKFIRDNAPDILENLSSTDIVKLRRLAEVVKKGDVLEAMKEIEEIARKDAALKGKSFPEKIELEEEPEILNYRLFKAIKLGKHIDDILKKGASPNAIDMFGNTPLINAVIEGKIELIEPLVNAGANLQMKNKKGKTARDVALQYFDDEMIAEIDRLSRKGGKRRTYRSKKFRRTTRKRR